LVPSVNSQEALSLLDAVWVAKELEREFSSTSSFQDNTKSAQIVALQALMNIILRLPNYISL